MKFLTKPTIFTQILSSKAYVYASTLLLLTCLLSYAFALGSFSFSLMYFTAFVALGGMAFALSGTFLKLGSFAFLLGRNKKAYLVQNKENKIKRAVVHTDKALNDELLGAKKRTFQNRKPYEVTDLDTLPGSDASANDDILNSIASITSDQSVDVNRSEEGGRVEGQVVSHSNASSSLDHPVHDVRGGGELSGIPSTNDGLVIAQPVDESNSKTTKSVKPVEARLVAVIDDNLQLVDLNAFDENANGDGQGVSNSNKDGFSGEQTSDDREGPVTPGSQGALEGENTEQRGYAEGGGLKSSGREGVSQGLGEDGMYSGQIGPDFVGGSTGDQTPGGGIKEDPFSSDVITSTSESTGAQTHGSGIKEVTRTSGSAGDQTPGSGIKEVTSASESVGDHTPGGANYMDPFRDVPTGDTRSDNSMMDRQSPQSLYRDDDDDYGSPVWGNVSVRSPGHRVVEGAGVSPIPSSVLSPVTSPGNPTNKGVTSTGNQSLWKTVRENLGFGKKNSKKKTSLKKK